MDKKEKEREEELERNGKEKAFEEDIESDQFNSSEEDYGEEGEEEVEEEVSELSEAELDELEKLEKSVAIEEMGNK